MADEDERDRSIPEKGTERGKFFFREDNPFEELDRTRPPILIEAEEELETSVSCF